MKKLLTVVTLGLASVAVTVQADEGQDIYNQYCVACHATGVGPMAHDLTLWQPRLDDKGGVEGLLASAKQGLNAMPPMGTCMSCTDDQLRAAITFMTTAK